MKEYLYKNTEAEITIRDGWLDTGDCGYYDEQGYYYLEAREKELINVGGRKVSPKEIEKHIMCIEDIEDCACVGMADPNGITGEVVKCFVVTKKDNDQDDFHSITDYLRDKIEPYKLPKFYEKIDEIPKTASGKIKRLDLKHLSLENIG
jgi:long-chain acyl-CoA synthetase